MTQNNKTPHQINNEACVRDIEKWWRGVLGECEGGVAGAWVVKHILERDIFPEGLEGRIYDQNKL